MEENYKLGEKFDCCIPLFDTIFQKISDVWVIEIHLKEARYNLLGYCPLLAIDIILWLSRFFNLFVSGCVVAFWPSAQWLFIFKLFQEFLHV